MGTWICHLRVAEKIAQDIQGFNLPAFYAGSLAPDSGIPNVTWTEFDPPKSITHYLFEGSGERHIRDLDFYNAYKQGLSQDITLWETSFLWGYYFHLLTDILWVEHIWETSQIEFSSLIMEHGLLDAMETIKEDWYGLDHRFLRSNPFWAPWLIFISSRCRSVPINHIPVEAINTQFEMINKYYSEPDSDRNLDRSFPYLNESTMQQIVNDCAAASLKIYNYLESLVNLDGKVSAVSLLPPSDTQPYPPPLGDIISA